MEKNLRNFLKTLISGKDLNMTEAAEFFACLQAENENENLLAAALAALESKGVSVEEIYAMAKIMRERCIKIKPEANVFVDLVGTGGSRAKIFNVSTAAALVIAGAGVSVAKHGNRAATSNSGSADVLTELGVNVSAKTEIAEKCLNEIGVCFLFAPKFHSLSPTLAKVRREIGVPTIFNVLGPICNPAAAPHQVIGVWRRDLIEKTAEVLARFGTKKTWIVHGSDGLDEITLNGKTFAAEISGSNIKEFEISPADFGLKNASLDNLQKFSPASSAKLIREILSNETNNAAARDLVLINAAAAIFVSGKAENLPEAFEAANRSLKSGKALQKLNDLIEKTRENVFV
jgi:anthranilate phosphoribosyltransferase